MMEKREIISIFLKSGNQIDASALEYFSNNPTQLTPFIERLGAVKQPPIITLDFIEKTLSKQSKLDVIKNFPMKCGANKTSVLDYSNIFLDLYESMKNMILEKVDKTRLLSINKIQKERGFVIIAMVREKYPIEKTILMEDMTGQINISFEDEDFETLYENDVVGVECITANNKPVAKKIIWPSIPFKKTVEKTGEDIYTIFLSDIHLDSDDFDKERYGNLMKFIQDSNKKHKNLYVFILGGISKKIEDITSFIGMLPAEAYKVFLRSTSDAKIAGRDDLLVSDSPMMVKIGDVTILLCQGDHIYEYKEIFGGSGAEVMVNLIKRRNLRPFVTSRLGNVLPNNQIITPIPNIFASGSFHSAESLNHKGLTLLTTGDMSSEPIFWAIDLKTREINKVDIA